MVGNESRHRLDAILPFQEILQVHRPFENLVQLFDFSHAFGFREGKKLFLQRLVRNEHFIRRKLVVERQRGAVLDAVGDGVFVQVAGIVLAAEGLEGALAVNRFVHRRAGEAEECRIRQAGHEEVAEIARCRAVRLVDEDIDVLPQIQIRRHVAELVDHCYDDAPVVVA